MNFKTLSLATILVCGGISHAHATLVLDQSGPLSDILDGQKSETDYTFDIQGIAGPMSYGPTFATPDIFLNDGAPAAPWSYSGRPILYTIELTTPVPTANASWVPIYANWFDDYGLINGRWYYTGGNDNEGGIFDQTDCAYQSGCTPAHRSGNITYFQYLSDDQAVWSGDCVVCVGTQNYEFYSTWINGVDFGGDLILPDLDASYRLQIFASVVPEPATWSLLIIGFGLVGAMSRKQRASMAPDQRG